MLSQPDVPCFLRSQEQMEFDVFLQYSGSVVLQDAAREAVLFLDHVGRLLRDHDGARRDAARRDLRHDAGVRFNRHLESKA